MATVLQFPKRNKGRVRKSQGWDSMGEHALGQCEEKPANVVRFCRERAKKADHDHGHLALMLSATMFALLPEEQRDRTLETLRDLEKYRPRDSRPSALLDFIDNGRR